MKAKIERITCSVVIWNHWFTILLWLWLISLSFFRLRLPRKSFFGFGSRRWKNRCIRQDWVNHVSCGNSIHGSHGSHLHYFLDFGFPSPKKSSLWLRLHWDWFSQVSFRNYNPFVHIFHAYITFSVSAPLRSEEIPVAPIPEGQKDACSQDWVNHI